MDKALILAYSVGGFQARVDMVEVGRCIAEHGSSNYAQLKWKDKNARGFLRASSRALQQVLLLSRLLTHFFNITTPDYQDIDALLPKASYTGRPPSHLLYQDASFLDHCVCAPFCDSYYRKSGP